MIRWTDFDLEEDVVPHAVFWRPVEYFSTNIRTGEDGLDIYRGASFARNNDICFQLRNYRGHPKYTSTLYFPLSVSDPREISDKILIVIDEMNVPETAVAWRRGMQFRFGVLERNSNDRLREAEARILALKIASQNADRFASTAFIKQNAGRYMQFSPLDCLQSPSRKNERLWQQILGNVVSHEKTSQGPFRLGYATKVRNGLQVTDQGVAYLNNMGFSS